MDRLRRQLAALAAFITLFSVFGPRAEAQTTRTRAIILSFEGWNAEAARAALESGLNAAYDMISEQQAVDTAMQIGVDPSTPEGLGAVVARLHIQLVIGGSVSGRGPRATTTIWVTDTAGNQLATRTAGSPSGRGFEGELTTAALQACGEAVAQLPPPTTSGARTSTGPGPGPGPGPEPTYDPESGGTTAATLEPEPEPEPAYDPDYDIENEVAGRPRGQGHGGSRRDDHESGGGTPGRWNQPYFRALAGIDIRNMSASTSGGTGGNPANVDNLPVPFAPLIGLWLEARPFAGNDDALRGLYGYLNTEFSAGQTYYRVDDMQPDAQQRDLYLYGLDFGVGYAGTIAEVFELIGTVGAGVDGLGLADSVTDGSSWGGTAHASCGGMSPSPTACAGSRDFPSIQAWYIRPDIQARIRLVDDLLMIEGNFAGRIIVSWGDLSNADFGSPGGGGIDWSIGLAGIIDPGFTWRARFGYSGNYVTFSDPGAAYPGDLNNGWSRDSGTIEAWRITLGIGWAFR